MNKQQEIISSITSSTKELDSFSKSFGKFLLFAEITWSIGENIFGGKESWFTDSLVDIGISYFIYCLSPLPLGFLWTLSATIASHYLEDEIQEFKEYIFDKWESFWEFNWVYRK